MQMVFVPLLNQHIIDRERMGFERGINLLNAVQRIKYQRAMRLIGGAQFSERDRHSGLARRAVVACRQTPW